MMEGPSQAQVGTMHGPSALSHWEDLNQSGKGDKNVWGLNDALFLFALRMVQGAKVSDLEGVWKRYQTWWIRQLPGDAYYYVKCEVARRATEGQEGVEPRPAECKQLTMKEVATDDNEPF